MIHRRTLVAVLLLAGLTVVLGTSGASSITSIHSVDVTTTTDEAAYLGFEQTTRTDNGTTELELTVSNQQSSATVFTTVELSHSGRTVDLADGDPLDAGEAATHTFTAVDCDETVSVVASGDEASVQFERAVDCG